MIERTLTSITLLLTCVLLGYIALRLLIILVDVMLSSEKRDAR